MNPTPTAAFAFSSPPSLPCTTQHSSPSMLALFFLAPLVAGQTVVIESGVLERAVSIDTEAGCPEGWPICGSSGVCYNPDEGQTCCPGGTYACPSSTFCLFDFFCCPNDQSPEACALENGISPPDTIPSISTTVLPETTQPPPLPSGSSHDAYATDNTSGTTEPPPLPPPTLPPTSGNSITLVSTPLPTSSLVPWPSYSVTLVSGSPSLEGEEEPAYTGGGSTLGGINEFSLGAFVSLIGVFVQLGF
ncbi:hypothetical protein BDV19DRAFT_333970 [Aspergillus venezuelensis]